MMITISQRMPTKVRSSDFSFKQMFVHVSRYLAELCDMEGDLCSLWKVLVTLNADSLEFKDEQNIHDSGNWT